MAKKKNEKITYPKWQYKVGLFMLVLGGIAWFWMLEDMGMIKLS